MKKITLYIAVLLTIYSNTAYSQEADLNYTDWDSLLYRHNQNQFTKPVTDKEFNQAIQTIKQFQKKDTGKKHWWSRKKENRPPKETPRSFNELPSSSSPLLGIPTDTINEGHIIPNGFYLIERKTTDECSYLVLRQGYKTISEIKATVIPNVFDESPAKSVKLEMIENSKFKIIYQDSDARLETTISIYHPQ